MKKIFTSIAITLTLSACSPKVNNTVTDPSDAKATPKLSVLRTLRPLASSKTSKQEQSLPDTTLSKSQASPSSLLAPAAENVDKVDDSDLPTLDNLTKDNDKDKNIDDLSKVVQTDVQSQLIASSNSKNGLVPPPPAVSISAPMPPPGYPPPAYPGYGGGYYPGYMQPPPYYYNQAPQNSAQPNNSHGKNSPFGNVTNYHQDESQNEAKTKPHKAFKPIAVTGMQSRSAFKQREDVSILWKSFLTTSQIKKYLDDDKHAKEIVSSINVSLPIQSTKGSLNVTQSIANQFFKGQVINDKRLSPYILKWELDNVTAYMHYLYAYNKFALAQQTVQARNQEVELCENDSDKQRAYTDLSQAKSDLCAVTDDMKAAQVELAQVSGLTGAKAVILRVSGVSPQLDGLVSNDNSSDNSISTTKPAEAKHVFGSVFARHGKGNKKQDSNNNKETSNISSQSKNDTTESASENSNLPIKFKLVHVNVTPRKSVINVSIVNNTDSEIDLNNCEIYVAEGNHKLPQAMFRSDFTQNIIASGGQTTANITIFGRPWNDMLNIVLVKDGHNINLIH